MYNRGFIPFLQVFDDMFYRNKFPGVIGGESFYFLGQLDILFLMIYSCRGDGIAFAIVDTSPVSEVI